MAKSQPITQRQLGASRRMLNALGGRHYADDRIYPSLEGLNKKQGVVLVDSLQHILHIRATLHSESMMQILAPLLDEVGVAISLIAAPPK